MTAENQSKTDVKRLDELASLWDEQSKLGVFDKFSPADLRLMLMHFTPLQDMIRQIANNPATPQPTANTEEVLDPQLQQLAEAEAELVRLKTQAREDAEKLKEAAACIEQQSAQITSLKNHKTQLDQEMRNAQQQAENLQQEVISLHKQLAGYQPPAELQTLRNNTGLVGNLGLDLPANGQQALIAMVAVLSQKDNLERLWDTLKERCEAEKRPASAEELGLLSSALGWYNHNWKLRPFQLLQPCEGDSFDYQQQQKAKHQTDGETLSQIWLPGLADGAGKPLRKTLVLTR